MSLETKVAGQTPSADPSRGCGVPSQHFLNNNIVIAVRRDGMSRGGEWPRVTGRTAPLSPPFFFTPFTPRTQP